MYFSKYVNIIPYPSSDAFTTTFWYRAGQVVCKQKPGESLAGGFDTTKCVKEKVTDEVAFKKAKVAYAVEQQRIMAEFKCDLFEELGIANHPMREKLYSKAWEDGHSSGFQEVYNCALNLVDLIEVPENAVLVTAERVVFGRGLGVCNSATIEAAEALARKLPS